jgi:uncharacterized membrane protein YdjX (TVP38/TMEM64 family)
MVPGFLLSAAAGVLFGPVLGTVVAITSAVFTAVLSLHLGRGIGQAGMREIGGRRFDRVEGVMRQHGAWAVIAQRLVPGVPDGPSNYAFGAAGVRTWQIALGTLVGSLPRAFAYAALGSAAGELDPVLAAVGAAVLLLAGLTGTVIAARTAGPEVRRRRARRAAEVEAARPPE